MKTTTLTALLTAGLMAVSIGNTYADEQEMPQYHDRDRDRIEATEQTPEGEASKTRQRAEKQVQKQSQYREDSPGPQASPAEDAMHRMNYNNRYELNNPGVGDFDRLRTQTQTRTGGGRR